MAGAPDDRPRISPTRLEAHVRALEGERHPDTSPRALEAAAEYVRSEMIDLGLDTALEPFRFRGGIHHNVVALEPGADPYAPRILVGAHYDTVRGSPGADDNASGVATLLECARVLVREELRATVELVAFSLEEQQATTYRVGSRRHAAAAREEGTAYAAALVFEMVGYTRPEEGSQEIPWLLRWMDLPRTGDFLAVVGDGRSRHLLPRFEEAAAEAAPELRVVTFRSPLRGWLVWQTRLSDNASFWSEGYPALMVTDTAFLRNPHYHRRTDTADTLDYGFMTMVGEATVEMVRRLAL